MKRILLLIFSLYSSLAFSQRVCSCEKSMEELVQLMENKYPGFQEKTKDKLLYNNFKNNLIETSKKTKSEDCLNILQNYTSFFKDKHVFFLDESNYLTLSKYEKKENQKLNNNTLKKIIKTKDSLEGIWVNKDYRVAIVSSNKGYNGIVISSKNDFWKPNDVLFKIDNNRGLKYYNSDLTYYNDNFKQIDECTIQLEKLRTYFVKDKSNNLVQSEINDRINRLEGFYVEKITPKTTLIRIKSFDYPFVERIKNLVLSNKELIENSENLIIDIRENGGGTTNAFKPLLPYIMTGSTRELNVEYLATDFLISGLNNYIKTIPNDEKNKEDRERIIGYIKKYEKNLGEFVLNPNAKEIEITKHEISNKSPKQVIFLADNGVGSSAESLLLLAKQSKKVKVIGTPTLGVLDYASARITNYDCNDVKIVLPTYRSLRLPDYPIDNIGIQPDIYMDKTEKDWVKFATEYLEN
ncbi:S41 family peptidase [Riemerella anatipestifer]|nr:S41 family peptidase [Riemerella anatipestifer]